MADWHEGLQEHLYSKLIDESGGAGTRVAERSIIDGLLANLPSKPYAQVASCPERGMKCRVVTKSPVALVTLGDKLRKMLFLALKRDRRISDSLEGDHETAVQEALKRALVHNQLDSRLHSSSRLRGPVHDKRGWKWNE